MSPLLPPPPDRGSAHDNAREDVGFTWGMFTTEAVVMGGGAWLYATDRDSGGALAVLILTALAAGIGAGILADHYDLDPTVPRALHGMAWLGLEMYVAGDALSGGEALPIGLASAGALAGGAFGIWGVRSAKANRYWMWTPILGSETFLVVAPTTYLSCGAPCDTSNGHKWQFVGSFAAASAVGFGVSLAE